MKIIMANNYHYLRGGSEQVYFSETRMLERYGHTVIPFSVRDPEAFESKYAEYFLDPIYFNADQNAFHKIYVCSRILYSFQSRKKTKQLCRAFDVDLAHFHNIYGRLNPVILPVFKKYGIPTVMTLHDYKLLCPMYNFHVGGRICEECSQKSVIQCFRYRCNKGSGILSLISALEGTLHNWLGFYRENLDILLAPSRFLRDKFIQYGWQASKIRYLPNFLELDTFKPSYEKGHYFLYMGRLSSEKGISTLIEAFSKLKYAQRLVIAGRGPIEDELKERVYRYGDERITFSGHLSGQDLARTVKSALAVVLPSECYENAPMSVLEALAYGKPVIGSRIGGIPDMVDETRGALFEPGNVDDLSENLAKFQNMRAEQVAEKGRSARKFVERYHSAEVHYEQLMALYNELTGSRI